jgi:hypothetical protein
MEVKMKADVTRGAESWQFFAFIFASLASLGVSLVDDVCPYRGWARAGIKLIVFLLFFYVFVVNAWIRNRLVRFLGWLKAQG